MSTYTEEVGKQLNDLLEKTYDAEKGFKNAADNVDHTSLKNYFKQKAQERYDFGHQLKTELKAVGHEIDKGGSVAGAVHRSWMDLKAFLSSDNEESMLEESIRGEKAAIEEYDDVLKDTTLPPTTRDILIKQKATIQTGLAKIKRLEDLS